MLIHHRATEKEKYEICAWKYKGEYSLYNMESYDSMKKKQFGFANPKMIVEAFFVESQEIGFCNLYDDGDEVFFGIGVNPDFCGQGYGVLMIQVMKEITSKLFPNKPLYLEVRSWNLRAIKCYQKAGFVIDGDSFQQKTAAGEGEFYRMVMR